jgi:hypothetical protein
MYLDALFAGEPETEELFSLMDNIRSSIYKVQNLSNDLEDHKFFQIEAKELKASIQSKGNDIIRCITDRVVSLCMKWVVEVLTEYEEVYAKLCKIPLDEDELFELKAFYRNIVHTKVKLRSKVESIAKHLEVLECFDFKYDTEEYAKYYSTMQWPINIDIAYSEGEQKLEDVEEKFKSKLDKEREGWYKNLHKLVTEFEIVQLYDTYSNYNAYYDQVMQLQEQINSSLE